MSYHVPYPLIHPLVERLRENGARLTDKAMQALNLAAQDVKSHGYKKLYDDSLFTGVLLSRGAITGFFESLGISTSGIIEEAHRPLRFEYRERFGRPRHREKHKRRRNIPIRDAGSTSPDDDSKKDVLSGLSGEVTTKDLALSALEMPARSLTIAGAAIQCAPFVARRGLVRRSARPAPAQHVSRLCGNYFA